MHKDEGFFVSQEDKGRKYTSTVVEIGLEVKHIRSSKCLEHIRAGLSKCKVAKRQGL